MPVTHDLIINKPITKPIKDFAAKFNRAKDSDRIAVQKLVNLADFSRLERNTDIHIEVRRLESMKAVELSLAAKKLINMIIKAKIADDISNSIFTALQDNLEFSESLQKHIEAFTPYAKRKGYIVIGDKNHTQWARKIWDVGFLEYTSYHISRGLHKDTGKIVLGIAKYDKKDNPIGEVRLLQFDDTESLIDFLEDK